MRRGIEKLRAAVQTVHRCKAEHVESHHVLELSGKEVAWEGVVEEFQISGHPKAKRCYAWSYRDGHETQFVTVLEIPPVKDVLTAIRASIVAQSKSGATR